MQRRSYFDENGIGKLKAYVEKHWVLRHYIGHIHTIKLKEDLEKDTERCYLVQFDDEFPSNIEDKKQKRKQIHKILQYFYQISTSEGLELSDFSISWNHILEIVHLEFDE